MHEFGWVLYASQSTMMSLKKITLFPGILSFLFSYLLSKIRTFKNTYFQKYALSKIRTFKNTYFQKYALSKIRTFKNTYFQKYALSKIRTFKNTYFQKYALLKIRTFKSMHFQKYVLSEIRQKIPEIPERSPTSIFGNVGTPSVYSFYY